MTSYDYLLDSSDEEIINIFFIELKQHESTLKGIRDFLLKFVEDPVELPKIAKASADMLNTEYEKIHVMVEFLRKEYFKLDEF